MMVVSDGTKDRVRRMTREKDRAEWTPGKNRTKRGDSLSTDHYDT